MNAVTGKNKTLLLITSLIAVGVLALGLANLSKRQVLQHRATQGSVAVNLSPAAGTIATTGTKVKIQLTSPSGVGLGSGTIVVGYDTEVFDVAVADVNCGVPAGDPEAAMFPYKSERSVANGLITVSCYKDSEATVVISTTPVTFAYFTLKAKNDVSTTSKVSVKAPTLSHVPNIVDLSEMIGTVGEATYTVGSGALSDWCGVYDLVCTKGEGNQINLAWKVENPAKGTDIAVQRDYSPVATLTTDKTAYTDNGLALQCNTSYHYSVTCNHQSPRPGRGFSIDCKTNSCTGVTSTPTATQTPTQTPTPTGPACLVADQQCGSAPTSCCSGLSCIKQGVQGMTLKCRPTCQGQCYIKDTKGELITSCTEIGLIDAVGECGVIEGGPSYCCQSSVTPTVTPTPTQGTGTGGIEGYVYIDANKNKMRDKGEAGVVAAYISFKRGTTDLGSARSFGGGYGTAGWYGKEGLTAGVYTLKITLPSGYTNSSVLTRTVTLPAGGQITGQDFGLIESSVIGTPTPTATTTPPLTPTPTGIACNDVANSGGVGVDEKTWEMGMTQGHFTFVYDAYPIPDNFKVLYEGRTIYDSGTISGKHSVVVNFGPGTSTKVMVRVTAPDTDTSWEYSIKCPVAGFVTTTPAPTATPTPDLACPRGIFGNLNCDTAGLIKEGDLTILLRSWSADTAAPAPRAGEHSADIVSNGHVDNADLAKLLRNWKTD